MSRFYEFSTLPDVSCCYCFQEFNITDSNQFAFGPTYACPHCHAVSYLVNVAVTPDRKFNIMTSTEPNP